MGLSTQLTLSNLDGLLMWSQEARGSKGASRALHETSQRPQESFRKASGLSERIPKVLGPCASVLPDWSQLVWTDRNLSEVIATSCNFSELLWP